MIVEREFGRGQGHRENTSMVQAILSIRCNVEGQGTAVGEPLGARQVAVMVLGDVPICCRSPDRRLSLGKALSPGVE